LKETEKSDEDIPNLVDKVLDYKIALTFLSEIDQIKYRCLDSLFRDKTGVNKGYKVP